MTLPARALRRTLTLGACLALGCESAPAVTADAALAVTADAGDAALTADAGAPVALRGDALPRTFQDDYLPEFRVTIAPADLTRMLTAGNDTRFPMTLAYMGARYPGTIRQRLGNNSSCGDKRQFRIDLSTAVTLPDGYRTDRFETDRGRCYVLHEWFSAWVARRASLRHPERRMAFKYTNVVAIYFNDALYHLQTLTEDVNRDLASVFEGTRNVALYNHGCFEAPTTGWIGDYCRTFEPEALGRMLDIPTFLYWAAVVKALVPGDNYPDTPYNWVLIRNLDTGVARPLGDDWDEVPRSWDSAEADPFSVAMPSGDLQRHFTSLLAAPSWRAQYRQDLIEARELLDPAVTVPAVEAKYRQVRELLHRVPGLHFPNGSMDWYDDVYQLELPAWLRARHAYLGTVTGM